MPPRDYQSAPVSDSLGLRETILGLSSDLEAMRKGDISPQDGMARAAVAKQMFNGVRLYLQALKTMEALATDKTPNAAVIEGPPPETDK